MRAEVLRVQQRLGTTTLYVTHDQTEAMTMGDRVGAGELLAAPVADGVAVTAPRVAVRAGDRMRFTVDPEALHFFDPDTHLAIR